MSDGRIVYGLSAIKSVGEKAAENIVAERNANGKYKSLVDFLGRVNLRIVNKKTIEALIFAGAFDSFDNNRRKLFLNFERAITFALKLKESPEQNGQNALFSNEPEYLGNSKLRFEEYEEFDEKEKYINEKTAIGFFLTGHPLEKYKKRIEPFINLSFGDDIEEVDASILSNVKICGVISDFQEKLSKKGKRFAIFSLIDFYGRGECIAFSKIYEPKKSLFTNNNLVFIEGKAEDSSDSYKIIVDNIYSVEHFQESYASNLVVIFNEREMTLEKMNKVNSLLRSEPGSCYVYITVLTNGTQKHFALKDIKVSLTNDLISNLKNLLGENNLRIN